MNINASIIDQRLISVVEEIRERASTELNITDNTKLKSLAFVYFCVTTILELSPDAAFDCLTEGGGDFGVDAFHISEEYDGEFTISLFQGKYKQDLEGRSTFPENAILSVINAIRHLFKPSLKIPSLNQRLQVKIEEARSLIRDGYIPQVRVLACNNGQKWNESAQQAIDREEFGSQVTWEHVNHDRLVKILQSTRPVNDTLHLSGQIIVEDMNYSRVLVGRITVQEIYNLIERHQERLLERNIRRYLGLQGNRVNEEIQKTLQGNDASNFYFYNNGITLTCEKFSYNALQDKDHQIRVENLQIINGGQSCMTIYKTLSEPTLFDKDIFASVLVRLYQLPSDNEDLVNAITFATNSQNPVDLKDLHSNDQRQQKLEIDIAHLGYTYRRKRSDQMTKASEITSGTAAEAILAIWRKSPHQAKFFTREHFGKLYDVIFTEDLNGTQVVIAVLLYRIAENHRKRPQKGDPEFVRYASCFIAMQMGRRFLKQIGIDVMEIDHRNLEKSKLIIEEHGDNLYWDSVKDVNNALFQLYGTKSVSLQQLSATFRRGDLVQILLDTEI